MNWLPDPPIVLVLLQKIEAEENLLRDSSELFWYFCMNNLSPEKFKERTEFWIDRHLEDSPKGGGFIDTKIRDYILQGPEKLTQIIIDKIDELSDEKSVPYRPDEKDDPIALYVYIHIEASRLARLLQSEQYSERTREALSNAMSALNRCTKVMGGFSNAPWSEECSVSLQAVGSFLHITQFRLRKSDGDYEDALRSLFWGFALNIMASLSFPKNGFPNPNAIPFISFVNSIGNIWEDAPWMKNLDPQEPVDCFEAIRNNSSKDLKEIANVCSFFVTVAKSWWPNEEQEIEVKDAKGESWSLPEYWQHALGWVEAQLQPSELRDLLNEREDQAAEQRLRTYFFGDVLWAKLPERTRRSIVSADRDWFSGSSARTEAILNELKIAVEELLIQEFWKPLVRWCEKYGQNRQGAQAFLDLKTELINRRNTPTILDFENICKMQLVGTYLAEKGVRREHRVWFIQSLPKTLFSLRQARNRAEHESGNRLTREELNTFYDEFIGVGQPGVIKQLSKLLNSVKDNSKS